MKIIYEPKKQHGHPPGFSECDLSRDRSLSKAESKHLVDRMVCIIADELANEGAVKLAKFGTFASRQKKQRLGRNPKTGKPVPIEARRVLTFKASNHLIDRVNRALS